VEGYYCDVAGMTAIDEAKKCPKGFYCPSGTAAATTYECPAGSYCPAFSSTPTACPIGKYSNATMGEAVSSCLDCLENFACRLRGAGGDTYKFNNESEYKCGAGFKCPPGTKDPTPAPQDYSSPTRSILDVLCPVGSKCTGACDGAACGPI